MQPVRPCVVEVRRGPLRIVGTEMAVLGFTEGVWWHRADFTLGEWVPLPWSTKVSWPEVRERLSERWAPVYLVTWPEEDNEQRWEDA